MAAIAEQQQIDELLLRLERKYPRATTEMVTVVVRSAHSRFANRPVRYFIPLLVERIADRTLDTATR
ncbi:three-helix bundle dimerization domain-containing protein [Nocardia sp. NPDC058058]|uniref:three-helix bundle dimerization domain-containing protein n=1 Tax=Nocardia sp. NPDC058058 TaxID=3346317 RepID=UPI0036DF5E98